MFLKGFSLIPLVLLQVVTCAPLQDDKIEPVDLSYSCIRMHVDGKGHNKSPILLIHGLSGSIQNWKGVQEVLALRTGRKVCAVDLRNHGNSPWSNQTDVATLAVDIGHFLDKENIEKVNIIGHSLGGKIAVHYTLNNPDRVDSLVVEDMRPNGITDSALRSVHMMMKFLQGAIKQVPDGATEAETRTSIVDFLNKKLKELDIDETIDQRIGQTFSLRCANGRWGFKANIDLFVSVLSGDPLAFWTESKGLYNGTAVFIYGKLSSFDVAGDKSNILKLFPNAILVGVKGARHLIHGIFREFVDEVIKLLDI